MQIEITGVDLVEFTKKVYELSVPQGLGILHFTDSLLTTDEANNLINIFKKDNRIALNLDYVHGRACKMVVFKKEGKLFIRSSWYDHTNAQLKQLLDTFNINMSVTWEHGIACNCTDCRRNR